MFICNSDLFILGPDFDRFHNLGLVISLTIQNYVFFFWLGIVLNCDFWFGFRPASATLSGSLAILTFYTWAGFRPLSESFIGRFIGNPELCVLVLVRHRIPSRAVL